MYNQKRFLITDDTCTVGFHENIFLNINKPIEEQLRRRRLIHRSSRDKGNAETLRKIIDQNSSLRISFGWSFESATHYKTLMNECIDNVAPKYNIFTGTMISDIRCSWLGFLPFNTFDKIIYDNMSLYSLVIYNNELIDFQIDIVKFVSQHKLFKQYSFLRNSDHRFDYCKSIRHDPDMLLETFHYYLESIVDTTGITTIPRQHIEEELGCHYLHHPEIFFELLDFYKLKGQIYE